MLLKLAIFGITCSILGVKSQDYVPLEPHFLYSIESHHENNNFLCACDSGFEIEWVGKVVTREWANETYQKWNLTESKIITDIHCHQIINLGNVQNNLQVNQGLENETDFNYILYKISWNFIHIGENQFLIRSCDKRESCLTRKGNGQRVSLSKCGYEYREYQPNQIWKLTKLQN